MFSIPWVLECSLAKQNELFLSYIVAEESLDEVRLLAWNVVTSVDLFPFVCNGRGSLVFYNH